VKLALWKTGALAKLALWQIGAVALRQMDKKPKT
jgi:hypothetical protein